MNMASPRRTASRRPVLNIRRLEHAEGLPLPAYQTQDAAGMDLVAALADEEILTIAPGESAKVPTGLVFELPHGTEGQVRPRSGLAAKHGVTVLNAPGTIDADYRGEVAVILINHGSEAFVIRRGDRIAQLVIAAVLQIAVKESRKLTESKRGSGGFGSTGVKAAVKMAAGGKGAKSKRVPKTAAKPQKPSSKRR